MELVREVYRFTAGFPAWERYGLAAQLQRASVSVPTNIAEGYARYGANELAHTLSIALGSLAEIDTLLTLAADLGYLTTDEHASLDALRARASRTTFGLQRKVRR